MKVDQDSNNNHNDPRNTTAPLYLENDDFDIDLENSIEPIPVAIPIVMIEHQQGARRRRDDDMWTRDIIGCCCRSPNGEREGSTSSWPRIFNQRIFQCIDVNSIHHSFLFRNLFHDMECQYMGPCLLFESIEAIRIFKFIFITIWITITLHGVVRAAGWGHDKLYSIQNFMAYDLGGVVLDSFVFAIVSRLHRRNGVDCLLPFFLPMVISAVYVSWSSNEIWFLQNSITLHDMRYTWSWQLYLYAAVCCTLIGVVLCLHIVFSIRDKSYAHRLLEMALIAMVFIIPGAVTNHETFHLHHYYSFWMLGMLFSREEWWSQVSMAIAWGQYINGIAAWGRDSVLTCEFADFAAAGNGCNVQISKVRNI